MPSELWLATETWYSYIDPETKREYFFDPET